MLNEVTAKSKLSDGISADDDLIAELETYSWLLGGEGRAALKTIKDNAKKVGSMRARYKTKGPLQSKTSVASPGADQREKAMAMFTKKRTATS